MPPKPRAPRKASINKDSANNTSKTEKDVGNTSAKDSDMPPPPVPLPPAGILEPEINALGGCLKNAVVKTGQVYGFYADARRLGIQPLPSGPPRALTASLGREVEKFDQLCDAMESHLLRAIAVLQRDLGRERQKILDAEKAAVASRTRSKSVSLSPTSSRVPLPGSDADTVMTEPPPSTQMSPPPTSGGSGASSSSAPGRRGSAISLSSLHRPFPHKLDLSATTMRITAEEASLFSSGPLASPVTLAPKSARPSEIPADLMAAFEAAADADTGAVDIDLTVLDNESSAGNNNNTSGHDMNMNMETSLGNSADKPIELDLDSMDIDMSGMSDLFGDAADGTAGLFSPAQGASDLPLSGTNMADGKDGKQDNLGMDILDALSAVGDPNGHDDLFRAFPQSSTQNQTQSNTNNTLAVPTDPSSSSGLNGAPSPGSILASFAAGGNDPTASHADSEASFDINAIESIDLSTVFNPDGSANNDLDFEELMKSGGFGGTS